MRAGGGETCGTSRLLAGEGGIRVRWRRGQHLDSTEVRIIPALLHGTWSRDFGPKVPAPCGSIVGVTVSFDT